MNNLFNFGLLTAFTILMALVADYLIAPALMVLMNPKVARVTHEVAGDNIS
jgi:predicted RND superfamily exporter protein